MHASRTAVRHKSEESAPWRPFVRTDPEPRRSPGSATRRDARPARPGYAHLRSYPVDCALVEEGVSLTYSSRVDF